ncbi:hypothetical protein Dimus_018239 [Dionaea muscipula]
MDVVKEFYTRMTVIHLKKKDVMKSSVKGVAFEFDHLKLASILGIPGNNGILQGESRSDDQSFDAQADVEEPVTRLQLLQAFPASPEIHQLSEKSGHRQSRPSGPSGHIPEVAMNKLQVEFERARANRFQADLEKAQAENARLLVLLQQAQTKPKP